MSPSIYTRGRSLLRRRTRAAVVAVVLLALAVDLVRKVATGDVRGTSLAVFLWDGVVLGLVLGLAGVGLSMTYNILSFANFAHGEYLTVGAFSGWVTSYLVGGLGQFGTASLFLLGVGGTEVSARAVGISVTRTPLAVFLGAVLAAGMTGLLALAVDRVVYRPMREQSGISLLIASIGVAFVLRYGIAFVFGTQSIGVTSGTKVPSVTVPDVGITVSAHEGTLVLLTVALMVGLHLFLQRTKLGVAMRAMADNKQLAQVTGIPTERIVRLTWLVGSSLTGIAGFLLVLERGTIAFDFGWLMLLLIFAAVILGGIGSIYGAILGGLTIGVASRLSLVWLPPDFMNATAFAVMILVLILRPRGLFRGGASV